MKKIILYSIVSLALLLPFVARAQAAVSNTNNCSILTQYNQSDCCSNASTPEEVSACQNYDPSVSTASGNSNPAANTNTNTAANTNTNWQTNPANQTAVHANTPASAAAGQNVPLNIHLDNPLSGVSTIPDAINKILSVVIRIALPLIIIFFIWSGLTFIFARGNPTAITKAKNMFLFTIIGTLLILGAWVITNAIIGTVNAIVG